MNDNNFPTVATSPDDLLDHNTSEDLRLRVFTTITGQSLMGIVDCESEDSFLVILPSRLLALDGADKRMVEPALPVVFTRYLKSAIVYMIPCFGEFEAFYIEYLINKGFKTYPEYFQDDYIRQLVDRLNQLKNPAKQESETEVVEKTDSKKEKEKEEEEELDMSDKVFVLTQSKYKH